MKRVTEAIKRYKQLISGALTKRTIRFEINNNSATIISGYPELEGHKGALYSDGMAIFFGESGELYIANTVAGKIRKFSDGGRVLVDDSEIDYNAIEQNCPYGFLNAQNKVVRYAKMCHWDGFKDGLCVISWTLYPEGRYFTDSDGFGAEDNDEEVIYAIVDTDLRIVEPFRPITNIETHLGEARANRRKTSNNKTMKTRIFNLIIIDESGSMQSIKKEAIDSVNETIQTIRSAQKKHEEQEHYVSLVTFNDDVKTIYECVPVDEVKELTADTYQPDCCTALYDAMGISLNTLRKKVAKYDKVLVTVVTDGYENASKEYNGKAIKALVDELKANGWVFAYIGANQDVEAVAATISITNVMKFEATPLGAAEMGARVASARSRLFDRIADYCFSAAEANEDFFDEEK